MANISCPYNTFCVGNASESCNDTAMYECADCNYSGFIALLCIAFILGVFIVMGNALIIAIFVQRWRKSSDMKTDAIKLSLAVADLVTGIQLFAFYIPNVVRTFRSTIAEDRMYDQESEETSSTFCGIINIFCFTSSLYHLLLLGLQRIFAVKCPLRFRNQTMKPVYISIALIWLTALILALVPTFASNISYGEIHFVCFFSSNNDISSGFIVTMLFVLVLPFVTMTIISIATAIVVHLQLRSTVITGAENSNGQPEVGKSRLQQQARIFKTIAIMQIGFVITVGPGVGGLLAYLTRGLPCYYYEVLLMACFVVYFTNSLVNIIVYSFREEKFRRSIAKMLTKLNVFRKVVYIEEDGHKQVSVSATANTVI